MKFSEKPEKDYATNPVDHAKLQQNRSKQVKFSFQ